MLSDLVDSISAYPIALLVLAIVLVSTAGLQAILRYTKPNIGYHCRTHRGLDRTFFIRNLDSVHYRRPFRVVVSGVGLRYVAVHAGPWCVRKPKELESIAGKTRVRIVFEGVPEDAAFALRAVSAHGESSIEIDPASPLQSRSFETELPTFGVFTKMRYYLIKYLIGFASFSAVFLLGLVGNGYEIGASDWILVSVGLLVSLISFALVVPYRGKPTIVGYLGPVDALHYWGDRAVLSATESGRMASARDSFH